MMEGPRKRGTRGGTGLSRTKSRPPARRRSVFFLRHISHEARLEDDFRFAFFFQPPPSHSLSLSGRGSREGRIGIGSGEVVSIDRGIDSSSNLKKERERKERKEERLRGGRGGI